MRTFPSSLQILSRFSFAVTVFLIPFRFRVVLLARPVGSIYPDYTDFILFAADAAMLATLALWLVSLVVRPRRISFGPFFISLPLAGLTITAIFTSFFAIDPSLALYHSLRLILMDAFYLFTLNEIRNLAWATVPLAFQIVVQAGVGILQFSQQHSLGLQQFGEYELDPLWSGVSVVLADGLRLLRAYGLTDHPNILGGCLAFALLLRSARFAQARPRAKLLTAVVVPLGAVGLLLTFSRTAFLAMGAGVIFTALIFWRTWQRESLRQFALLHGLAAIFVLLAAFQNAYALGVRLNPNSTAANALEARSLDERAALDQAANRIFADRALTGVGLGVTPQAVRAYYPIFDFYYQPAHITLLDAAVETGIFGGLFYFVLMIAPWAALWINRARLVWSPALIGASAVLLAITIVGFFDYYTWLLVPGRLWQWMTWGLWANAYSWRVDA
jgi:O-antigen ligase/polysaccharide polymerase Wzy-like membrane protein